MHIYKRAVTQEENSRRNWPTPGALIQGQLATFIRSTCPWRQQMQEINRNLHRIRVMIGGRHWRDDRLVRLDNMLRTSWQSLAGVLLVSIAPFHILSHIEKKRFTEEWYWGSDSIWNIAYIISGMAISFRILFFMRSWCVEEEIQSVVQNSLNTSTAWSSGTFLTVLLLLLSVCASHTYFMKS